MTKRSSLPRILGEEKESEFSPVSFLFDDKIKPIDISPAEKLRNDLCNVIGKIVLDFSSVEFFMKYFISTMLDKNVIAGKLVVMELTFRDLQKIFLRLFFHHEKDESTRVKVKEMIDRLNDLYKAKRNRVVHDFWDYQNFHNKVVRIEESYSKKERRMVAKPNMYTIKELNDIAENIFSASVDFSSFMILWLDKVKLLPTRKKRSLVEIIKEIRGK